MVVHKTKVFSEYYTKLISVEAILISEARLLWGNLKTNDGPGGFYSYSSSDDRMRVCRGPSSASTRNTIMVLVHVILRIQHLSIVQFLLI